MNAPKEYMSQGFLLLRGFYTPRFIQAVAKSSDELLHSSYAHPDNIRSRYQYNSGQIPERFDPVTDIAPILKAIAEDPKLLAVVENCIGETPILFKDKLLLKSPGTDGYPMHQDYAWWGDLCEDPRYLVTVAIAIDEVTLDTGPVQIFSPPPEGLVAIKRNMNQEETGRIKEGSSGTTLTMKPGDVLLLHPLAPHTSARNRSSAYRRMLYLTYNAVSKGDLRTSYYQYYIARERSDETHSVQKYFW